MPLHFWPPKKLIKKINICWKTHRSALVVGLLGPLEVEWKDAGFIRLWPSLRHTGASQQTTFIIHSTVKEINSGVTATRHKCDRTSFQNIKKVQKDGQSRRKIRLIEFNAKCRHLKKLTLKWLCGRCLSVWGPEPHTTPYTLYMCIQYMYLFTQGKGEGGDSWTREKIRGATVYSTKLGRKYQHDWLCLQSINSDKHLSQSPFTGKFF
jgi:hypothetical protein